MQTDPALLNPSLLNYGLELMHLIQEINDMQALALMLHPHPPHIGMSCQQYEAFLEEAEKAGLYVRPPTARPL